MHKFNKINLIMKIKVFTFLVILAPNINAVRAAQYESNSANPLVITKVISLPDGTTYSSLDSTGAGTNNFGIYEILNCAGHRISKENKLKEQRFFCNVELSNGHFYSFLLYRSDTDTDSGVGYAIMAGGSKPFEKIKDKKCRYAVSFYKNQAFVKLKCKVSEEFVKEITK